MSTTSELYQIADEIRAMAAMGLKFATDHYDLDRYKRLLEVSARLVATLERASPEEILEQFAGSLDHVCPRLGADAAVFRDGKILLIKRSDNGLWCTPGGQVDVGESLAEAALRELWEETGLRGEIVKFLGVFDSRFWNSTSKFHMYHNTFLVEIGNAEPQLSNESTDVGFFAEDNLPPLFSSHRARVPFTFKLWRGEMSTPYFDKK